MMVVVMVVVVGMHRSRGLETQVAIQIERSDEIKVLRSNNIYSKREDLGESSMWRCGGLWGAGLDD